MTNEAPCPQCGSPNSFRPRRREDDGVVEIFIKCRACPYEKVLRSGPRPIVELELEIEKLEGKIAAGQSTLEFVLRKRKQRLEDLRVAHGVESG